MRKQTNFICWRFLMDKHCGTTKKGEIVSLCEIDGVFGILKNLNYNTTTNYLVYNSCFFISQDG